MEPVMMIEDIMKILPHRYPFLLVDRVIEKNGTDSLVAKMKIFLMDIFQENQLCQGFYKLKQWHKQLDC